MIALQQSTYPITRNVKRSDLKLAQVMAKALSQTKQSDAFEFRDREDQPIRVERVKLARYGYCYRIHHSFVTYVLPFDSTHTRTQAQLLVMEYLRDRALYPTFKLMPGKAFTFKHPYTVVDGKTRSSEQVIVRESWS